MSDVTGHYVDGIQEVNSDVFATGDGKVICWKGDNFYKACDEVVTEPLLGGQTLCVKRIDHPGDIHEDYSGYRKGEDTGKYVIAVTVPLQGSLADLHDEVREVMRILKETLGGRPGRQVYNAVKEKADELVMILEGTG